MFFEKPKHITTRLCTHSYIHCATVMASITQLGRYLICEAAGRTATVSLDGMQTEAMMLER